MPNTKLSGDRLKTHWQYSRYIYLFGTLVTVLIAALVFTMVTNRTPPNQYAVGIALVRSYSNVEKLDADKDELLRRGQEYDETLQSVTFMSVMFDGDTTTEEGVYGAQLYTVQLSVGENDIFIQNEAMTQSLYLQNYLIPLEELDAFDDFMQRYPDAPVIWDYEPIYSNKLAELQEAMETIAEEDGIDLQDENAPKHAYYIDISSLTGFIEKQAMDNRGMYAGIIASSANPDTSMFVLGQLFELFAPTQTSAQ